MRVISVTTFCYHGKGHAEDEDGVEGAGAVEDGGDDGPGAEHDGEAEEGEVGENHPGEALDGTDDPDDACEEEEQGIGEDIIDEGDLTPGDIEESSKND